MTLITNTYPTLDALREAFEQLFLTPTCLFWPTQEVFDQCAITKCDSAKSVVMRINDTIRIHHDVDKPTPIATIGYWAAIG